MEKSLTWIKLDERMWLLVCVEYMVPFSINDEKELLKQGIGLQGEGSIISAPRWAWRSYRIWKIDGLLTEQDKRLVEDKLYKRNPN